MVDVWLPGAERIEAPSDGGGMTGGPPRATWHTTQGSSIEGAVSAYRDGNCWPTLTWDPRTGRIVQHVPADRAARALANPKGGVQTNRFGDVHVQVEVVARAEEPFTDGPMTGFGTILAWLDSLGVPREWPAGQPLAYGPDERRPDVSPAAFGLKNGRRDVTTWTTRGGHFGHSQVPENDHGDPGRIDISRWTGPSEEEEDMTPEQAAQLADVFKTARNLGNEIRDLRQELGELKAAGNGVSEADKEDIASRVAAKLGR